MEFTNSNIYSVVVALIIYGGGAITTYLTVVYRKRVIQRRQPKDRIEIIFDGYDALIEQVRHDLSRKDDLIKELQGLAEAQAEQLRIAAKENERLHGLITDLQLQLKESAAQTTHLEAQLKHLRTVVN